MTDDKTSYVVSVCRYDAQVHSHDTIITKQIFAGPEAAHLRFSDYLSRAVNLSIAKVSLYKTDSEAFDDGLQFLIEMRKHFRQADGVDTFEILNSFYAEDYKRETIE